VNDSNKNSKYYDVELITTVKSFIIQAEWEKVDWPLRPLVGCIWVWCTVPLPLLFGQLVEAEKDNFNNVKNVMKVIRNII
jgi:hypothetical protein